MQQWRSPCPITIGGFLQAGVRMVPATAARSRGRRAFALREFPPSPLRPAGRGRAGPSCRARERHRGGCLGERDDDVHGNVRGDFVHLVSGIPVVNKYRPIFSVFPRRDIRHRTHPLGRNFVPFVCPWVRGRFRVNHIGVLVCERGRLVGPVPIPPMRPPE